MPAHWDLAVSIAAWRAEMLLAQLQGRAPDEERARAAFERNPFQWVGALGLAFRVRIAMLWTWFQDGERQEFFQTNRLDNALSRDILPPHRKATDGAGASDAGGTLRSQTGGYVGLCVMSVAIAV